ncbi:MAG TPA: SMP-30/gluconolactonase/LRE family protein [Acidimicrobiales bacterium]|nr:SMP-30/gluconolactonase/LRE family protein [Acidimicrobiales bacterium]
MGVTIRSEDGRELLVDAEVELVQSGFDFTEGPAWSPGGGFLVFSDIPGDQMWRWDEAGGVDSFRKPSHMANGNTYDMDGRLITCEHATSRLTRAEPDGTTTVLAATYGDQELNSPNDVIVARDGTIYFTDPSYGRSPGFGVPRPTQLGFRGLYRLRPGGPLELLADDFDQPNGLCLSLDERILYVNDSERMDIRAYTFQADGRLAGGEVLASTHGDEPGNPDGMKIDELGHIWCAGQGGIHVFTPSGSLLGILPVPEVVGNFAWGGEDLRWLFVCASTGLYRVRTSVAGHLPWAG